MFALFNQNKEFIGYSPDLPEVPNLAINRKKIPDQFCNLAEWHWEGNFDTGKMVSNKKIIELNNHQKALKKIIEIYPLGVQIINIIKQLDVLSKNSNLFDNDFKEMSKTIMDILSTQNK